MSVQRTTEAPIHEPMLIDGKRIDDPARIEVCNPARPDELVGTIVRGTPDHVDRAVAAAKAAQPAWAAKSFTERAAALAVALDRLEADIEPRAAVFVRENGKPLTEARGELVGVAKCQRMALAFAPELEAGRNPPNLRSTMKKGGEHDITASRFPFGRDAGCSGCNAGLWASGGADGCANQ